MNSPRLLLATALFLAACGGGGGKGETPAPAPAPADAGIFGTDGGLGFYSLQTPGLPAGVAAAGDSVYEVRVVANSHNSARFIDVSRGRGAVEKRKILRLPESELDTNSKTVIVKQIEFCESQELSHQKACPIFTENAVGSAFVIGDGASMMTAAHVVEHVMDIVEQRAEVPKSLQFAKHQRVLIFVFNRSGQLVVDPFLEPITLEKAPRETYVAQMRKNFYAEDSDYVTLRLSKPLGKPLHFAVARPVVGQRVFVLGYAACTGCAMPDSSEISGLDLADRSPAPNSDGKGLKVSFGRVVPYAGLTNFFGMNAGSLRFWEMQSMVFSRADSQHGQSGGPVLNEAGEVVSVHGGGQTRRKKGALVRISRASGPAFLL
jgi:hypothetical protein